MEELKQLLENYDKPLSKEQLEKIIYNIFCIAIFFAPAIPEIIGFGIYSFRNTIFIFTTIITAVSLLIINRKNIKNIQTSVYDKLLIVYMILVVLSTIFTKFGIIDCILGSNGRGEGFITIFSYVATFVIFSRGYKQMKPVSKIAIIAAVIVCVYSFIQANHPDGMKILFAPNTAEGVATGTMRNQNFLSSYICIFLPMACFYYINKKTKTIPSLIFVIILFMTQIYSVSLGGYITFAIMYTIIIIYSFGFSQHKIRTVLRIGILSLMLFLVFTAVNYKQVVNDKQATSYVKEINASKQEIINLTKKSDNFGSGRLGIWRGTLNIIGENILLGVGPDSLMFIIGDATYIPRTKVDKAHSEPLQIAVTTGVPSAIIYVIFVGIIGIKLLTRVIKKTIKYGIEDNYVMYITMVLICFASYLMQSVINISVVQVAPLYWAILGTAVGVLKSNKMKENA